MRDNNTYLSIDLDYYTGVEYDSKERYQCLDLVNKALELRVPTIVVDTHHGLTEHINKMGKRFELDHLINIDFHDDIVCKNVCGLTEGTWVIHINWKNNGLYEWRYPSYTECISNQNGICDRTVNLFDAPSRSGWYDCARKEGLDNINWDNIKALGICLSGFWLYGDALSETDFDWSKPWHAESYNDLRDMYEDVLCMLTNKRTFDEAFWFVQSSYTYSKWGWSEVNCKHFWSRYLAGKRDRPWTNPPIKFVGDKDLLMSRFDYNLRRQGLL
jgi:hypothetical protein